MAAVSLQKRKTETEELSSRDRLLDAVVATWAEGGHAAISARGLSQSTGLPTSSIYHHFGSLDELLVEAQTKALRAAENWCTRQLELFTDLPAQGPDAFPGIFASLVDDWAREERALGFAWRECHLLAARDPRYHEAIDGWRALWPRFWEEISAHCGLASMGEMNAHMFDAESLLHMMQWRRPIDRACLDEFASGWGQWLSGSLTPEGPWRRLAREEASKSRAHLHVPEGVAAQIAAAAADVMEENGVSGLTHRAVAERSGLTLGTVSYNFRTSADLVRGTFETLYSRIISSASVRQPLPSERTESLQSASPLLLAIEELMIAVARDPAYAAFAPQLRYLRGRTSGIMLQSILGNDREVSPLDAALYSSFLSGQGRALARKDDAETKAGLGRGFDRLIGMLKAGPTGF